MHSGTTTSHRTRRTPRRQRLGRRVHMPRRGCALCGVTWAQRRRPPRRKPPRRQGRGRRGGRCSSDGKKVRGGSRLARSGGINHSLRFVCALLASVCVCLCQRVCSRVWSFSACLAVCVPGAAARKVGRDVWRVRAAWAWIVACAWAAASWQWHAPEGGRRCALWSRAHKVNHSG